MIQIAPSILSSDFSRFRDVVVEMSDAGADWIHFDVMDGQFVPPITFGAQLVADLRSAVSTKFEAHLMTQTPDRHFDAFIDAGCERIIFHQEVTPHSHRLIQMLKDRGIQAGIAINPATSASTIEAVLGDVDVVLVMTVNPGWGGQKFIESTLAKIAAVRALTNADIEVDGGIDPTTIGKAHRAGANVFVTGSYLAKSGDVRASIQELRKACAS